jgi:pimeloyl-ACP methyl ester carboxylesterase
MKTQILKWLLIISTGLSLLSCKKDLPPCNSQSKTFVLVHGAWQAPWCWDMVKQQLESAGQKVVVVQLPGHGSDYTPPQTLTLDAYRDIVVNAINAIDAGNAKNGTISKPSKVELVGHSLAGMIISEVAEEIPNRIDKLIYIGAYLPGNNQSLLDLASTDGESLLGQALIFYPYTLGVPLDSVDNIFCQDCSLELKNELIQNYRDEPLIPFTNSAHLSENNFGKADKYYIHTLMDHVVGPSLQERMIAAAQIPDAKVFPINSSHCPFLSRPEDITELLLHITH